MATQQQAVRVMVNPDKFALGLRTAKRLYGKYEPQTKTWVIPASHAEFVGTPQNPGLIRVEAPAPVAPPAAPASVAPEARVVRIAVATDPAPVTTTVQATRSACLHYTRSQGCPLHGETCNPDYR